MTENEGSLLSVNSAAFEIAADTRAKLIRKADTHFTENLIAPQPSVPVSIYAISQDNTISKKNEGG
jgi:hypothetical protein